MFKAGPLVYDGIHHGEIALENIPQGHATADFKMLDAHKEPDPSKPRDAFVIASNVDKLVMDGAPTGYEAAWKDLQKNTDSTVDQARIQPLSGQLLGALRKDASYLT